MARPRLLTKPSDTDALPQTKRARQKGTPRTKACLSCRSRKKRCDEAQPSCHNCKSSGIKCEWPRKVLVQRLSLRWNDENERTFQTNDKVLATDDAHSHIIEAGQPMEICADHTDNPAPKTVNRPSPSNELTPPSSSQDHQAHVEDKTNKQDLPDESHEQTKNEQRQLRESIDDQDYDQTQAKECRNGEPLGSPYTTQAQTLSQPEHHCDNTNHANHDRAFQESQVRQPTPSRNHFLQAPLDAPNATRTSPTNAWKHGNVPHVISSRSDSQDRPLARILPAPHPGTTAPPSRSHFHELSQLPKSQPGPHEPSLNKVKMLRGQMYDQSDHELTYDRAKCRVLLARFNASANASIERRRQLARTVVGSIGANVEIEAPFRCEYGYNIKISNGTYIGPKCVIEDPSIVSIGSRCFIRPRVTICCKKSSPNLNDHDGVRSLFYAPGIWIKDRVCIEAGVIIHAGVRIGRGSTIVAGSVVTKSVRERSLVGGNPATTVQYV